MKPENKLELEWLTKQTGDPFADTGGLVIKYLWTLPQLKDKDILGLIDYAANIYVNRWGGKLHAFFLNHPITQPTFKGRQIEEVLKYYKAILEETKENKVGYCRISGRKAKLFPAGRDNHILSGSGTFLNFHHNLEAGLFLSKEVLIRIFFVPLGVVQIGKKLGMIQCNRIDIQDFFVRQILFGTDGHFSAATISLAKGGVLRSNYTNPAVALFSFADECIANLEIASFNDVTEEIENDGVILSLYYFSNYSTDPNIELYFIPAHLFRFYATCIKNSRFKSDWNLFVNHYYIKHFGYNSIYDQNKKSYSENTNELVEIDKNFYELMAGTSKLNFNIAEVSDTKNSIRFSKSDYDYWKQKSKDFTDWQKETDIKVLLNSKPIKTIKGKFVLNYKIDDVSKKWVNIIYEKLLRQETILPIILNYLRKRYKTNSFNFKIVKLYTQNILKMKSTTLNLIEKIAIEVLKDESNLKKNINQYLSTSRFEILRSFILKLVRRNHKAGEEKPILTLDEYAKDLFCEGGNWKETRDLLLICIFQKMHENKIFFADDSDEEEFEDSSNETETANF